MEKEAVYKRNDYVDRLREMLQSGARFGDDTRTKKAINILFERLDAAERLAKAAGALESFGADEQNTLINSLRRELKNYKEVW